MIKNIKFSDGIVKPMKFDEEFINKFKPLCVRILKRHKNGRAITEDDYQELNIILYEAFLEYNESTCFTTFVSYKAMGYASNSIHYAKSQKRDSSKYTLINLDYNFDGGSDKDLNTNDLVEDKNVNIEEEVFEKDFVNYLIGNLSDFERDLLDANLKKVSFKELCEKYGLKKTTLSNRNYKFKERLKNLINKYNSYELLVQ